MVIGVIGAGASGMAAALARYGLCRSMSVSFHALDGVSAQFAIIPYIIYHFSANCKRFGEIKKQNDFRNF